MEIIARIPDDLAMRFGNLGELERRGLEALALEEYKLGHLTKPELRRLLGFETQESLDRFLKAHDVFDPYSLDDLAGCGKMPPASRKRHSGRSEAESRNP